MIHKHIKYLIKLYKTDEEKIYSFVKHKKSISILSRYIKRSNFIDLREENLKYIKLGILDYESDETIDEMLSDTIQRFYIYHSSNEISCINSLCHLINSAYSREASQVLNFILSKIECISILRHLCAQIHKWYKKSDKNAKLLYREPIVSRFAYIYIINGKILPNFHSRICSKFIIKMINSKPFSFYWAKKYKNDL